MKILFLIGSLNIGGAERQLINLAKGLSGRGHAVIVVTFYGGGALDMELKNAKIPFYDLGKKHRLDIARFFNSLRKIVKKEKPDIIHSYLSSANILTIPLKPFFHSIHLVWGVRASNMDLSCYDWLVRLGYPLEGRLSRFSDLIIVNSHVGLEYAASCGFPRDRMIAVHNGIDTGKFRIDPKAQRLIRRELNIDDGEVLVGLAARIDPMKDHATFLRAAAILARQRPDVRFMCVGDEPDEYKQRLKTLSVELGMSSRLLWAGLRRDMPWVFNAMDLHCSSSAYGEGFSNAIGEAMACGVPCVVTDVGDSAIIVGDSGEIVAPRQPQALAEGLKTMVERIEKNRVALRKRARDRIVMQFSLEHMVSKTEKALVRLVT